MSLVYRLCLSLTVLEDCSDDALPDWARYTRLIGTTSFGNPVVSEFVMHLLQCCSSYF
jgi:hypothetical protein